MRIVNLIACVCGMNNVDLVRVPWMISRYCVVRIHVHVRIRTSDLRLTLISSELSGRETCLPFLQVMKTNQRAETNFLHQLCWSNLYAGGAPASS